MAAVIWADTDPLKIFKGTCSYWNSSGEKGVYDFIRDSVALSCCMEWGLVDPEGLSGDEDF